jgi:hypothetical protein
MKNLTKNTLLITLLFVSFCFCACDNEKKNEIEAKIKILNTEILDLKNESENSFIELEKNAIELITDKKEKSEAYKKLASRLYEKANKHGRIAKLLDRKQSEIDSLKSLLK